MRRRQAAPSSLTSLLDVMFILVFASIAQAAAVSGEVADADDAAVAQPPEEPTAEPPEEPTAEPTEEPAAGAIAGEAPADAGPGPDAGAAPARLDREALHDLALAQARESLSARTPVFVRISAGGVIGDIDAGDATGPRVPEPAALLERVADPDIGLAYRGDRSAASSVCAVVRRHLGAADLRDRLVVIAPEQPLSAMSVALVGGLRRDLERCLEDQLGLAVIVEPGALEIP